MGDEVFGQIIDGDLVEQVLASALKRWMPDYLAYMERARGYSHGTVQTPLGYVSSSEFETWAGDQLPVIVTIAASAVKPMRREDGSWEATWPISAACIVSDIDQPHTRKLGMIYVAAARAAILQHKRLLSDEFPSGLVKSSIGWDGEDYAQLRFDETRSLFAPLARFEITVQDVVTESAGPREPSEDPQQVPESLPALVEIETRVEPLPLGAQT